MVNLLPPSHQKAPHSIKVSLPPGAGRGGSASSSSTLQVLKVGRRRDDAPTVARPLLLLRAAPVAAAVATQVLQLEEVFHEVRGRAVAVRMRRGRRRARRRGRRAGPAFGGRGAALAPSGVERHAAARGRGALVRGSVVMVVVV